MTRRSVKQLLLLLAVSFHTSNAQPTRHLRRSSIDPDEKPLKQTRDANPHSSHVPPDAEGDLALNRHNKRDLQFDEEPLLDYETRVVGGTKVTDKNKHPYFAEWRHQYCGAALIHDDLVLSAAHCAEGGPFSDWLYFRTVQRSEAGLAREIIENRPHPYYNGKVSTRDWDYLLLKLDKSALVDDSGHPTGVQILPINTDPSIPAPDDPLWGIGFGALEEDETMSPTLQEATVQTFNNETCQKQYGNFFEKNYMFCSGVQGGGTDTCGGDSGGPMVHQKTRTLVGVVSFGVGCARPNYFGVNSRVSAVSEWLLDSICNWSNYPKCNGRYINDNVASQYGKAGFTGVERAKLEGADSVSVSMRYRFRLIDYRFRLLDNPTIEVGDQYGQGEPSQEEWDGLNEAMRQFWIDAMTAQYLENPKSSFVIVDAKWELDSTTYDSTQEFPYTATLLTDIVFTKGSTVPSSASMKSEMKSALLISKNVLRNSYVRKALPENSLFRDTLEIKWE